MPSKIDSELWRCPIFDNSTLNDTFVCLKPYSYHNFSKLSGKKSWKLFNKNFSKVSTTNYKTNSISHLNFILAFVSCINHSSQANIFRDMKFPKNHSEFFWRNFLKNDNRNRAYICIFPVLGSKPTPSPCEKWCARVL